MVTYCIYIITAVLVLRVRVVLTHSTTENSNVATIKKEGFARNLKVDIYTLRT